nr:sporulation YhaL family protein [Pullulanibacillus pueri]
MPIWIIAVILGIIISAWQFLKSSGEEEQVDPRVIEDQGKVYIHRMEEERERRRKQKTREEL